MVNRRQPKAKAPKYESVIISASTSKSAIKKIINENGIENNGVWRNES
jgi:hypothetical protein